MSATSTELAVVVVHPRTGEVITLADAATTDLAEFVATTTTHERELKAWKSAAKAEIGRRLKDEGRRETTVGGFHLKATPKRESVWDPDDLEAAMQSLVDDGVLQSSECVGVVKREVTVDRTAAKRLLAQLDGEPRDRIAACMEWVDGKPTVDVKAVPA